MNHIWQKEKRYFISIQHINSNRQDSIFHKGEKSYWESMDCSSEVNYAEPQCALNVVWAVAWRSSLRTSSPCTEGEERWKLLVCLDKQSVWKVKLPFKMLKLTRKSRQTGFACLFKKWEKTRYHYWHFKGAEKCFEEFNNKSVVSVMSFFTFWKGKTANFFFYVPNSSSYHKDQKGPKSEGNVKAWYNQKDMMYSFPICPFPKDLCYSVLLNIPTGYFNPVEFHSIISSHRK